MAWRKIQIDFVTNLPEQCGYRHCLTVVDLHTQWIELKPLKTNSACEAVYNLYKLICRFGCPEIILSNRGMYITSNNLIYYYVYYCGKSQLKQHWFNYTLLLLGEGKNSKIFLLLSGTEFVKEMNSTLNRLMGLTAPAHINIVKRTNRTTQQALVATLVSQQEDWLYILPSFMLSLRMSPHSSTGKTPYEMMFGRKPPVPKKLSEGSNDIWHLIPRWLK